MKIMFDSDYEPTAVRCSSSMGQGRVFVSDLGPNQLMNLRNDIPPDIIHALDQRIGRETIPNLSHAPRLA